MILSIEIGVNCHFFDSK